MYLYGKNSVAERLKKNPKSISLIYLEDTFSDSSIEGCIKRNNLTVRKLPPDKFSKIKHSSNIQGIIAEVGSFEYADFDEIF